MRCEVLIIGGGPTGTMLAVELRRRGVDCWLVDREAEGSYRAGGLMLNPLSLELLQEAGALPACRQAGLSLQGTRWFSAAGDRYLPLDLKAAGVAVPEVLVVPQDQLCGILRGRALELGCQVRCGLSFEGFRERGQGQDLRVTLLGAFGAEVEVDCRYLVGCDGALSRVRQAAGLGFPGQTLDWVYTVGELSVDWPLPGDQSFEFLGPSHVMMALPLPTPGRYRLSTWESCPPGSGGHDALISGLLESPAKLSTFEEVVSQVVPFPVRLSNPAFLGRYRVARRIADRFRSGRICLAGDAAHVFPPVTGLGMNFGLQDSAALAEAIAQGGTYELLEGYHLRRSAAARQALDLAERSIVELATTVLLGVRGEEVERRLMAERWGVHVPT